MKLQKQYKHLKFPEAVIRRAISVVQSLAKDNKPGKFAILKVSKREETWNYDDVEDFFAEFPEADDVHLLFSVPLAKEYWECQLFLLSIVMLDFYNRRFSAPARNQLGYQYLSRIRGI